MKYWSIGLLILLFMKVSICNGVYAMTIEIDPGGKCHIEGREYPVIGFGTYPLKNEICFDAVNYAAQCGYRILDTATFYDNFEPIGQVLKLSGRENFYLISKVWPDSHTPGRIKSDIETSLQRLQTTYIDAYLLHWPNSNIPIEDTLHTMNQLRMSGKIRHIGLSNVNVNHVKRALEVNVPISWVQVEMHPFFYDDELIKFCHDHGIGVQAWAPLGRGRLSSDPLLKEIGERYGKTASQVALRWIVQHGCMPIPGSQNNAHIRQNIDSLNFTLSAADMRLINERARNGERERVTTVAGLGFSDEFDFSYEECWPNKIKLQILKGHEIAPHVKEIVQFVNNIYRNPPYFYNGDDAGYEAYLESFPNLGDVIVCLALEDKKVIGIAVGLPMPKREIYQEPLLKHGYDLNRLFYLGEFGLKPEYQGRGIEATMYQNIEDNAIGSSRYNKICFWEIESTSTQNNPSYFPSNDFWKQLGFIRHPELNFQIFWTNIGDTKDSAHKAVYWMKNLRDL